MPGAVGAALLTAAVGTFVAYFAPRLLDQITGENDLEISLQTNPAAIDTFNDLSQELIVPRGNAVTGDPGQGCSGFSAWGAHVGGVRASRTDMRIIAQAGADQVSISGIRARMIQREPPLQGTGFVCPSAGAVEIRSVAIDLDEPDPTGRVVEGGKSEAVAFTVGENDTEIFDITAFTEKCYCKWVLELVTTQGGDEKIVTVDNDGVPFETTAWGTDPLSDFGPRITGPYYSWDYEKRWYGPGGKSYPAAGGPLPQLRTVRR